MAHVEAYKTTGLSPPTLDEGLLGPIMNALASSVAEQVWPILEDRLKEHTPWLTRQEAYAYSKLPKSTFDKLAAQGKIPKHGRLFHRGELDNALLSL